MSPHILYISNNSHNRRNTHPSLSKMLHRLSWMGIDEKFSETFFLEIGLINPTKAFRSVYKGILRKYKISKCLDRFDQIRMKMGYFWTFLIGILTPPDKPIVSPGLQKKNKFFFSASWRKIWGIVPLFYWPASALGQKCVWKLVIFGHSQFLW